MSRKRDKAVVNNEASPQDSMSEIRKLQREILDKLNKLTNESEENKKTHEQKHADVLEKLQTIHDLVSDNQSEVATEANETVGSTGSSSCSSPSPTTPDIGKSFVLKHVFNNVEGFEIGEWNISEVEEHFGVEWCINLVHEDDNLEFFLHVQHPAEGWEIETESEFKIIGNGNSNLVEGYSCCFKESTGYGKKEFLKWEEMKEKYLVDGNLTAEARVKIIETKGLSKRKLRSFDESVKEVSDIVLVVEDRKFFVNKTFLAAQSSFFKALLLGNFAESKKSEVLLTGIDPEDFHFFLEVLYGEPSIDETNVEGIALLADMYDAPTAIRRCEEYMIRTSRKSLKRKLHLADQYHLGSLKKRCLAGIKTLSDVRAIVPKNIEELEHSTMAALLEKALSPDASFPHMNSIASTARARTGARRAPHLPFANTTR